MLVFREDKKKVKNLQTSIIITIIISFTSKKPVPDWPQKIVEQACCVPVITPPTVKVFVTMVYQLWIFVVPLKSEEALPKIKHLMGFGFGI